MKALSESALAWLFVPGDQPHRIAKALASGADVVIVDLEDAVAPEAKAAARETVREACAGVERVVLRVNAAGTAWFADDLALARELGVAGVMLPKCEGVEALEAAPWEWIPLVESAAGVLALAAVAKVPDVRHVAFGAVDFALDLGVEWTREGEERRLALERLALESRAYGLLPPIGAAWPLVRDAEGFAAEARREQSLGFGAKLLIHPAQIAALREVWRPDPERLAWAARVVAAYEAAGGGAVALEGAMIDLPVYLRAKRWLEAAGTRG